MNVVSQRVEIAKGLVENEHQNAYWYVRGTEDIGRVSLKTRTLPRSRSYFYELCHVASVANPQNRTTPIKDYSFMTSGVLIAVIQNEYFMDEDLNLANRSEVFSAMEFQTQNGLYIPTPDDEAMLDRLLHSSLGNTTLVRGEHV